MLTRFEVTRLVGLRALQLSEGAQPLVVVPQEALRCNLVYVAALELFARRLDMRIARDRDEVDVREEALPRMLSMLLDTCDGGCRSYESLSVASLNVPSGNLSP